MPAARSPDPKPGPLRLQLLARIAAAIFGGYALCWGFIALGLALLYTQGILSFHDAEHLSSMLGLLLYLLVFCWAFVARSVSRLWVCLLGGAALMAGAASLLQRAHL